MGPVWTWESLESTTYTMRALVLVLLGLVAINAEAEANHHVYNSVVHHGYGHVAGVHPVHPVYNHHAVPAVHHYNHFMYGKREAEAEADPQLVHHTSVGHVAHVPTVHHVAGVYAHPYHYNHFMYGKREAEAEAEADPVISPHWSPPPCPRQCLQPPHGPRCPHWSPPCWSRTCCWSPPCPCCPWNLQRNLQHLPSHLLGLSSWSLTDTSYQE